MFYYLYNKVVCTPNTHFNTYLPEIVKVYNTSAQRKEHLCLWSSGRGFHELSAPLQNIVGKKKCLLEHWHPEDFTLRHNVRALALQLCSGDMRGVTSKATLRNAHPTFVSQTWKFPYQTTRWGFFQQPGGCSASGRWKGIAASLSCTPALSTICQPKAHCKNGLKRPSNNYYNPLARPW